MGNRRCLCSDEEEVIRLLDLFSNRGWLHCETFDPDDEVKLRLRESHAIRHPGSSFKITQRHCSFSA